MTSTARYSPHEIKQKLREAHELRESGATVAQVIEKLGVNSKTYYRWRAKYAPEDVTIADLPPNEFTSTDGKTFVISDPPDGTIDSPSDEDEVAPTPHDIDVIRERANQVMAEIRKEDVRADPKHVHELPDPHLPKWEYARYACTCGQIFVNTGDAWA